MKTYREKLKDPRWQKMRLGILERDEFKCQICFDGENTLHVHHRYYAPVENPWDYPLHALVTLCESCHEIETIEMPVASRALIDALKAGGIDASEMADLAQAVKLFFISRDHHVPVPFFGVMTWLIGCARANPEVVDSALCAYFEALKEHNAGNHDDREASKS